jgi:hypothetical protein
MHPNHPSFPLTSRPSDDRPPSYPRKITGHQPPIADPTKGGSVGREIVDRGSKIQKVEHTRPRVSFPAPRRKHHSTRQPSFPSPPPTKEFQQNHHGQNHQNPEKPPTSQVPQNIILKKMILPKMILSTSPRPFATSAPPRFTPLHLASARSSLFPEH